MGPIPPINHSEYYLRDKDVIGRLKVRTEKFNSSFYPNCLTERNKLKSNVRLAPSVSVFKKSMLQKIRPSTRSVFDIHDPIG